MALIMEEMLWAMARDWSGSLRSALVPKLYLHLEEDMKLALAQGLGATPFLPLPLLKKPCLCYGWINNGILRHIN